MNYLIKRIREENKILKSKSTPITYLSTTSDRLAFQEKIKKSTGYNTIITRFPGGSSNTVSRYNPGIMTILTNEVVSRGYKYFDWNVSSKDAASPMRSVDEIVKNCTADLERFDNAVILLHDAANKNSTVEALPEVIEKIQAMENTEILPKEIC